MKHPCSVNYNEAYLLVLQNGCLGVGLGDDDLNFGWLEIVGLIAPDISNAEYLEFNCSQDGRHHYHCKSIRPAGRFMGYIPYEEIFNSDLCTKVRAPVELEPAAYGLRARNFEAQLKWIEDHNIWGWSFYPEQGRHNGEMCLIWAFTENDDALLFKLAWS